LNPEFCAFVVRRAPTLSQEVITGGTWNLPPTKRLHRVATERESPCKNDGKTVHKLTVKDVPVDGFWSISVYNKYGYFEKNDRDAYTLNNTTAKKDADGSVTIQFGGCDGSAANCIPITPGWNYWVRLYRPRKEILDGTWKFPEAQPVS
jgi:hypothetical protein